MGIFIHQDQEERFWAAALGAGSRVGRLLLNSHSGPLCPWLPPLLAPSWAGISPTERPLGAVPAHNSIGKDIWL